VGRSNDALVELVIASLIGPDDPDALTAIGQIQFDSANYAAAELVLRRAVAIKPTLAQAHYLLGHSLARLSRANEGQEQLEEFERLRTAANEEQRRTFEIDLLREGAAKATDAGRHDEAADVWRQVVEREPQRPEHRTALAAALIRAGRAAEAVQHLEAATRLDGDIDVYRQLAELYATLGRVAESAAARETFQHLLRERRRAGK
jgi:Flp pilus assembly protein TadD